jgi:cytochrome c biogenesis protein CcmG, thiol:disulfide interchange protein DsbE
MARCESTIVAIVAGWFKLLVSSTQVCGLVVATFLLAGCAETAAMPPSAPSALLNLPLPSFRRPTLQGQKFDTAGGKGRVVVVKFFAKYCAPCQKTLPAAEALHRELPDVVFLGVAEDEYEREVREQIQQHGLSFPIVHDTSNVLAGRFRVREMPATFVSDTRGRVVWVGGPEQSEDELERAVEAVREQP